MLTCLFGLIYRSGMNQLCVRRKRRAKRFSRPKMYREERPPRIVSGRTATLPIFLSLSFCLDSNRLLPSVELLLFCFCHTHNFLPINALAPRRPPPTPWEKNLVSRLLTPTFSYLARSKSAGCQSGEEGTLSPVTPPPQPLSLCVHIFTLPLCVLMLLISHFAFSFCLGFLPFLFIFFLSHGTFSLMVSQKPLFQLCVSVPVQLHTTSQTHPKPPSSPPALRNHRCSRSSNRHDSSSGSSSSPLL